MNIDAVFGGDFRGILGGDADDVLHLGLDFRGAGRGQVDFVDHRQHFQPCVNGKVGIGKGLGLHALGGVHHQHRTFACSQGTGHFVVKVHMARGVDQVQGIGFPVVSGVVQGNGGCLDGDAPLPLQFHRVQQLLGPNPLVDGVAGFQQPVGQGGLAVVNVGNDRKIANFAQFGHRGCSSTIRIP